MRYLTYLESLTTYILYELPKETIFKDFVRDIPLIGHLYKIEQKQQIAVENCYNGKCID
jgi:hypothetical protein